jgi:hypothetical protein
MASTSGPSFQTKSPFAELQSCGASRKSVNVFKEDSTVLLLLTPKKEHPSFNKINARPTAE